MQSIVDMLLAVPPVVRVAAVFALGAFASVSVAGRIWPQLGRAVFDPDRAPGSREHLVGYTVMPSLAFAVALALVAWSWEPAQPWFGGRSPGRTLSGMALVVGGTVVAVWAYHQLKLHAAARPARSSVKLLAALLVGGVAALVAGLELIPK